MALPRANRLSLRLLSESFRQKGKPSHSKNLSIIKLSENSALQFPQFAFTVSKKKFKRAVDRNLVRRRLSGALLGLLSQIPPSQYLLLPQSTFLSLSSDDILKELKTLLKLSPDDKKTP